MKLPRFKKLRVRKLRTKIQNSNIAVIVLLMVLGLIAYAGVVNGPFVFDDNLLIVQNDLIRSFVNVKDFFTGPINQTGIEVGNFYRPIQLIVYTFIYHFWELNPVPYHLASILIHCINAVLVYFLMLRFKLSRQAAFIGGLLFLLHPVQTQAVSYVSGIADPLGVLFLLSAIHTYLWCWTRKKAFPLLLLLSIVFVILGILSKENLVIAGPLLYVIYSIKSEQQQLPKKEKRWHNFYLVVVNFLSVGYTILRFTVLNFTGTAGLGAKDNIYTNDTFLRIKTFVSVIWDYALLLVLPVSLFYEKSLQPYPDLINLRFVFGLAVIFLILRFIYKSFFAEQYQLFLALCWIVLTFIPVSGIVTLNAVFLEHWLYLPMIGISMLIAYLYDRYQLRKLGIVTLAAVVAVSVLFGFRVYLRNIQWSDPLAFYENELRNNQLSSRMYNNLAFEYRKQRNHTKALLNYTQALELDPENPVIHYNIGNTYRSLDDIPKAFESYVNAIRYRNNYLDAYQRIRDIFLQLEDEKRAEVISGFIDMINDGKTVPIEDLEVIFNKFEENTINM